LRRVQVEPDTSAATCQGVLDGLAIREGPVCPAPFCSLQDLIWSLEEECAGQRGFEVLLEECYAPPLGEQHEVHVDTVARQAGSAVELLVDRTSAAGTDSARAAPSTGGLHFAAHRRILGEIVVEGAMSSCLAIFAQTGRLASVHFSA
jgi:hypothetical protein